MNKIVGILLGLLKKFLPQIISSMLGGNKNGAADAVKDAIDLSNNQVEWIEHVKAETGATGVGNHPLDRLLGDAIESEETKAKFKRGARAALDVGLGLVKKIIL